MRWGTYSKKRTEQVRTIPGRSFVKRGGPHWHVPLDMEGCRALRATFGDDLQIGAELLAWAKVAVRQEHALGSIAQATTSTLERLPMVLPALYRAIHLGPLGRHMTPAEQDAAMLGPASYQAADVNFLVQAPAPLNGNEQGTGKTIEWIAAVWEAGMEDGDHLVICPKAAVDGTWLGELTQWQAEAGNDVEIFACVDDRDERWDTLQRWQASTARVRWVVVNPAMVMYQPDPFRLSPLMLAVKGKRKEERACRCSMKKGAHEHYQRPYEPLVEARWRTICIDEAHKAAVRNHRSLTAKSFKDLIRTEDGKPCLMSGTPMKKRGGSDFWGMLHYLDPERWSSFWRFADEFYEITDNGFGKKVGKLREDRQEAFFRAITPYTLRRTKKEVAPWLPEKQYVDVPVRMTSRQEKQYRLMEKQAAVMLGSHEVMAGGVLDQIVRLKQFANAHCKVDKETGFIIPIASAKVDAMIEKMEEIGMFEPGETRQQLVFSQSRRMVDYIVERLRKEGLEVGVISGKVTGAQRRATLARWHAGDIRVLVSVTTAGGVSLTLDEADEVHLVDEMWAPDDDAQAEDRAHRVSRIHQVTIYIYRSIGTVDEDISMAKIDKAESHELILDVRRRIMSRVAA